MELNFGLNQLLKEFLYNSIIFEKKYDINSSIEDDDDDIVL